MYFADLPQPATGRAAAGGAAEGAFAGDWSNRGSSAKPAAGEGKDAAGRRTGQSQGERTGGPWVRKELVLQDTKRLQGTIIYKNTTAKSMSTLAILTTYSKLANT